jgi:hypothetical protein
MKKWDQQTSVTCRQARKRFAALDDNDAREHGVGARKPDAVWTHVQACSRCARRYRLFALQRAALNAAAAPEAIVPDEDFFRGVRARIARGPQSSATRALSESWTSAVLLTARQLVPAMALLLLVMIGVTLFWNRASGDGGQVALRPRERVMFSDMYDYPAPTRDDVLETLVAIEEKENGK